MFSGESWDCVTKTSNSRLEIDGEQGLQRRYSFDAGFGDNGLHAFYTPDQDGDSKNMTRGLLLYHVGRRIIGGNAQVFL